MGERDEDEILLPPGSTFRVVDYQVLVGGLRVIKLRHIGTWVSEEIYHRPEIEVRFLKNLMIVLGCEENPFPKESAHSSF